MISVLTTLGNQPAAVAEIVRKISQEPAGKQEFYFQSLLMLAGLRGLEGITEQEIRKVPLTINILDNKVLGTPTAYHS